MAVESGELAATGSSQGNIHSRSRDHGVESGELAATGSSQGNILFEDTTMAVESGELATTGSSQGNILFEGTTWPSVDNRDFDRHRHGQVEERPEDANEKSPARYETRFWTKFKSTQANLEESKDMQGEAVESMEIQGEQQSIVVDVKAPVSHLPRYKTRSQSRLKEPEVVAKDDVADSDDGNTAMMTENELISISTQGNAKSAEFSDKEWATYNRNRVEAAIKVFETALEIRKIREDIKKAEQKVDIEQSKNYNPKAQIEVIETFLAECDKKAASEISERKQQPSWGSGELYTNEIVEVFVSLVQSSLEYGVDVTHEAVVAEVWQMISRGVFSFLTPAQWRDMNSEKFQQLLPCALILKGKYSADNEFQKVKARLVVLGNLQRVKYGDMFAKVSNESPTVSLTSLFSILVLAAKKKLKIASFDVAGAFLHAELEDSIYMKLSKQIAAILLANDPDTYEKFLQADGSMIVVLKKCLYGLRESPRKWYELVKHVIMDKMGFTQSQIDTCAFYKTNSDGSEVFVALYVDDMLVVGSDTNIDKFGEQMKSNFGDITSYRGDEIDFLGMKVSRDPNTGDISVRQQGYIESIVEEEDHLKVGKEEASPHYSNFAADKSKSEQSGQSPKVEYFKKKVMQLMYLAVRTRPDILFDIVVLAARLDTPSNEDLKSLDRILRFVYQTRSDGMRFKSKGKLDYNGSVDASFNCYETGKGHSGFCLFPDLEGSAAILYKSLKQKTVTKSSTESELVALKEAVQNILNCAELMMELDKTVNLYPIIVYQDNESAIRLVNQPVVNRQGRSKFINRSLFQVNENIVNGEIVVVHQNTNELVADFFTKALHGHRYRKFRARIMGQDEQSVEVHLGDTVQEAMESILLLKDSRSSIDNSLDNILVCLSMVTGEDLENNDEDMSVI